MGAPLNPRNPPHPPLGGCSVACAHDLSGHLRVERPGDGVALLTLDNPGQRNAMSGPMTASWVAAIEDLRADPSLRVVVVTGEGPAFCSAVTPRGSSASPTRASTTCAPG